MALKVWTCNRCGKKVTGDECDAVRRYLISKLQQQFDAEFADVKDEVPDLEETVTQLAREEGLNHCLACISVVDFSPQAILRNQINSSLEQLNSALFQWHEVEVKW